MAICPVCGKLLTCVYCQTKEAGKKSVKERFKGKTKAEISVFMKKVSAARKKV